jgi:hypothetical protein
MPFQFFKSKTLLNTGSIPPFNASYVKTSVYNINDGGEILKINYNQDSTLKNIVYVSGSITSPSAVSNQISNLVTSISASDTPFVEIPESEFVDFYSSSIAFFDNLG